MTTTAALRFACEGSNQQGHPMWPGQAMCIKCGRLLPADNGMVGAHDHPVVDALAMIDRGDYG